MKGFKKLYLFFLLQFIFSMAAFSQRATIKEETLSMKTYMFSDPNPVPEISRIYPYFSFDGYTNQSIMKDWKMVVLENDYIKVYVCPEIGGKVWGAIEKSTGKEFLYFNHVVKFRDVAMRGPWTSGGLEYNFGDIGHIPTCATPVDYCLKNNKDGSVSCVVGAEDLPSRTHWNVEIIVYPDKAYFETKASWQNDTSLPSTYYHWMNAAAKASGNLEFEYPGNKQIGHGGEVGEWPIANDRDLSFYENNNFGSYKSYHVINAYSDYYGGYWHDDNFGFGHWSNYDDKPGKKLWIWGLSPEGMIWENLLTDNDGQYIEFQAGKLFNQAANSSTYTPFKHKEFSPYDSDIMNEIWFPLKETKGMKAASKYGVLNVEKVNNKTQIFLSPLQNIDEKLRVVSYDGKTIYSNRLNLKTLELWTVELDIKGDFRVELGDKLLNFDSNPKNQMVDRPVNFNADFDFTSAYGLYIKGFELEKQRLYNDATEFYEKSLEKEPAFTPSLNRMALNFYRKLDYDSTLKYVRKSLAVDTYDGEANYIFGLVSLKTENINEAKSGFSIAASSIKYRNAAYTMLANIFTKEKDYLKAKEYARKALHFNAYNLSAYEILALVARKTGHNDEATKFQKKIYELDAVNSFYKFEKFLLSNNDIDLEHFTSSITNELTNESYLSLALRYVALGCNEEARNVLYKAPRTPEILLWESSLEKNNGAFFIEKALSESAEMVFPFRVETTQLLEKIIKQKSHWKLHYYLGLSYWNLGLIEKTKKQFELCENDPDFSGFYLAKSLLYKKDSSVVAESVRKARELNKNDWRAAFAQINLYEEYGKFKQALDLSKEFLKKFPEKAEIGLSYAQSLIQLKRYKEVVSFLEKFNVLPNEGATIGHKLYNEACVKSAINAYEQKKYKEMIRYSEKAKLWPLNLGVGQSFNVDERLENYIHAIALEKLGKNDEAQSYFKLVANYNVLDNNNNQGSKILFQLLALKRIGKVLDANKMIQDQILHYPNNKYLKWVDAKFSKSNNEIAIEKEIINTSITDMPYDIVFVDNDFELVLYVTNQLK